MTAKAGWETQIDLLEKKRQEFANTQLRNEGGSSDDGGRTTKGTDVRIAGLAGDKEEKGDFSLGGQG